MSKAATRMRLTRTRVRARCLQAVDYVVAIVSSAGLRRCRAPRLDAGREDELATVLAPRRELFEAAEHAVRSASVLFTGTSAVPP